MSGMLFVKFAGDGVFGARSRYRSMTMLASLLCLACVVLPESVASSSTVKGTTIDVRSSSAYGAVLVVGSGLLAGFPLYEFSGDADGTFRCTTAKSSGYDLGPVASVPLTCTGPMSDMTRSVTSDDWPALTSKVRPHAGPGVNQKLLGTVYRPGIGDQVTYAGHPLYLFDPPSFPFAPQGERYMETVKPLAPWHGYWFLVSATSGLPAPGVVTVESGTLPDGSRVVAVEEDPNLHPLAVTVYSLKGTASTSEACVDACAVTWIPVLTNTTARAGAGISSGSVGVVRRSNGTYQVTYDGKALYLYSREKVFLNSHVKLTSTGTAGNGNGLRGPDGGTFSVVDLP
jgi:predicted lipoprotein with Yx(FWY)xxD motif